MFSSCSEWDNCFIPPNDQSEFYDNVYNDCSAEPGVTNGNLTNNAGCCVNTNEVNCGIGKCGGNLLQPKTQMQLYATSNQFYETNAPNPVNNTQNFNLTHEECVNFNNKPNNNNNFSNNSNNNQQYHLNANFNSTNFIGNQPKAFEINNHFNNPQYFGNPFAQNQNLNNQQHQHQYQQQSQQPFSYQRSNFINDHHNNFINSPQQPQQQQQLVLYNPTASQPPQPVVTQQYNFQPPPPSRMLNNYYNQHHNQQFQQQQQPHQQQHQQLHQQHFNQQSLVASSSCAPSIPCQGNQPWTYAYCYGYGPYSNQEPCQFTQVIDIEDFMGQHKNNAQIEIFINFMELHTDLAKGFVKGDRVHFEQLWQELTNELNASGPPTKEVQVWKKVWTDMKLSVKQRLAHNRVEIGKTGGGRFNKFILSPADEQIANICGLYASVDGVENAKRFGVPNKNDRCLLGKTSATTTPAIDPAIADTTPAIDAAIASASTFAVESFSENERPASSSKTSDSVDNRKRKRQSADIDDVLEMEADHFSKICANLYKIKEGIKDTNRHLKESNRHLKESNRHLSDISKNMNELVALKAKYVNEQIRHNYAIEKSMKTKLEIKLKFLELEQIKHGVKSPPTKET